MALVLVLLLQLCGSILADGNIPILIGYGRDPKWSPGEMFISLITHDSLFVTKLDSAAQRTFLHFGPIIKYEWLNDSTVATQERWDYPVKDGRILVEKIIEVSLQGNVTVMVSDSFHTAVGGSRDLNLRKFPDGSVAYFDKTVSPNKPTWLTNTSLSDSLDKPGKTHLFVDVPVDERRSAWGPVWLYYGSKDKGRRVTLSENHYMLPNLAPTQDKFLCWSSRGMVVFDTLGNELANFGSASMAKWDDKGETIVFCVTEEGHYDIEKSEIFVARFDGANRRQLTDTPDIVEYRPSFSPSAHFVLYSNEIDFAIYVLRVD